MDDKNDELHGYNVEDYGTEALRLDLRTPQIKGYSGDIQARYLVATSNPPYVQNYEKITMQDLKHFTIPLSFAPMEKKQRIYELLLWFDIDFTGSGGDVTIGAGPTAQDTHWHQVQLVLKGELVVQEGDTATGSLKLDVNSQRGYDIALDLDWSDGTKLQQQWDLSQKPQ